MRIKVNVRDRSYDISCGSGVQDLAWLALSAAYLYGKDTYPRGNPMPTLLTNPDGRVIHPRCRISESLQDGAQVHVVIRDLSEPQEKKWVNWFEKAFGTKRNVMKVTFRYEPKTIDYNQATRQNTKVFVRFNYVIYQELTNEFDESEYPSEQLLELQPLNGRKKFECMIKLPFGEIPKPRVCEILNPNREGEEPKDLQGDEQDVRVFKEPRPWGEREMAEVRSKEMEDLKREKKEIIQKSKEQDQERNKFAAVAAKNIYDVWRDAPTALAPHFTMLNDIFALYANFHYPEEEKISAHDFFHFLRTFGLVEDMEEVFNFIVSATQELDPALADVLELSLSLYNFLYFFVKFASIKHPDDPDFNLVLDCLAKNKECWLQDYIKYQMMEPDIFSKFMDYEDYLKNQYLAKATPVQGHRVQLHVPDFVQMIVETEGMKESEVLMLCKDTLNFNAVKPGAEYEELLYPDFLETLLRVAQVNPLAVDNISGLTETQILSVRLNSLIVRLCGIQSRAASRGDS